MVATTSPIADNFVVKLQGNKRKIQITIDVPCLRPRMQSKTNKLGRNTSSNYFISLLHYQGNKTKKKNTNNYRCSLLAAQDSVEH